jgi:hypothetical protein
MRANEAYQRTSGSRKRYAAISRVSSITQLSSAAATSAAADAAKATTATYRRGIAAGPTGPAYSSGIACASEAYISGIASSASNAASWHFSAAHAV